MASVSAFSQIASPISFEQSAFFWWLKTVKGARAAEGRQMRLFTPPTEWPERARSMFLLFLFGALSILLGLFIKRYSHYDPEMNEWFVAPLWGKSGMVIEGYWGMFMQEWILPGLGIAMIVGALLGIVMDDDESRRYRDVIGSSRKERHE
jgi:hypothetical protein